MGVSLEQLRIALQGIISCMTEKFDKHFISKYLKGQCTEQETKAFEAFLKDPYNSENVVWMKEMWETSEAESKQLLGVEDRILGNIEKRIASDSPNECQ